ncbi:MAG: competence protein [Symbiobacteriaceae bacterium]|nr:competence protein [Symbiobacteriaceae bacterium]
METQLEVCIEYSQIVVCDFAELFNGWTDRQVKQGFSWRPGVVAFGTPDDRWDARLIVRVTGDSTVPEGATRAIVVPYNVPTGRILVGSVTNPHEITVPIGTYELTLAMVPTFEEAADYYLTFTPAIGTPEPRILLADGRIVVPDEFDMDAKPAL